MSKKLNSSPDKYSSSLKHYQKRLEENPDDENANLMIDFYKKFMIDKKELESSEKFKVNNLEYDLRTSDLIKEKCRDDRYAQALYAAMCNTEWQKLDVIPILKEEKWSCSWRYAGGIVADIREAGSYLDWYCSGLRDYHDHQRIPEGEVTDEIRDDLKSLGWVPIEVD